MVITVYADRRSHEVVGIAGRLARAIATVAATVGGDGVVLVGSRLPDARAFPGIDTATINDHATPQDVSELLTGTAHRYHTAVVALSGVPNEQVLAAFDASDRVLLVTEPSVASIRGTQRTLKLFGSLGYGADKTLLVLHDFGDDTLLDPADVAIAFKREIFFTLPGHAAGSASAEAYTRLAGRLISRT